MSQNNIVILGAGISGIGAAFKIGKNVKIYEKSNSFGGLCDNFTINNFRFDYAVHLSFATEKEVREVFDEVEYITHEPISLNYSKGFWLKHPVQNNTFNLPVEEKIEIIKGFVNRDNKIDIKNYDDWLKFQYGRYFTENYPQKYTRKYWCCEANELSTTWINNRMYQPSLDEVLYGAMTDKTPNTYYAKEMRYPVFGGYKNFFAHLIPNMDIKYGFEVIEIRKDKKSIVFSNGSEARYSRLISSLPLPEIINIINDVPLEVQEAANRLTYTSIALVSVGFNKIVNIPSIWFYVYDEDIIFARAYSPSMKSKDNVPVGKSSLQFEIYYTNNKKLNNNNDELTEKIISSIIQMDIASHEDIEVIDVRHVKYANVIFYLGMEEDRAKVHKYLKSINIDYIGRFGEWDYLWSNQSFLSGYNIIK